MTYRKKNLEIIHLAKLGCSIENIDTEPENIDYLILALALANGGKRNQVRNDQRQRLLYAIILIEGNEINTLLSLVSRPLIW